MNADSGKNIARINDAAMPVVSVIVVTYNQEGTLGRTIDSILGQETGFAVEVLVSDDCSTDGTERVGREYAERFPGVVKYHRNERNLGVQGNYFGAMRRARGKYLADCAGDDYWIDPLKLAKEVKVLDENPDVTIVHTAWKNVKENSLSDAREKQEGIEDGNSDAKAEVGDCKIGAKDAKGATRISDIEVKFEAGKRMGERLIMTSGNPQLHLCTALYRRATALEILEQEEELMLNPEYRCEDLQLSVELAYRGTVAYLADETLAYTVGHESISSTEDYAKSFDFYFGTLKLRIELARKHGLDGRVGEFRELAHYVTSRAFKASSRERMKAIVELMDRYGIPPTPIGRIYRIMRGFM